MAPTTFFIASIVTVLVLLFIRKFWYQLLVIYGALLIIRDLLYTTTISALLWAMFVTGSLEGFGWTFAYFFVLYAGILVTLWFIAVEAYHIVIDLLRGFFSKVLK